MGQDNLAIIAENEDGVKKLKKVDTIKDLVIIGVRCCKVPHSIFFSDIVLDFSNFSSNSIFSDEKIDSNLSSLPNRVIWRKNVLWVGKASACSLYEMIDKNQ